MPGKIDYSKLSAEDFDSIVTGELVKISIFLEHQFNNFLSYFFTHGSSRKTEFRTLFLHGPYLTFQDKIDITRSILQKYYPKIDKRETNALLKQTEEFKHLRNVFSHGFASLENKATSSELTVEMTNRSGKTKRTTITPENHEQKAKEYYKLMKDLHAWRAKCINIINRRKS